MTASIIDPSNPDNVIAPFLREIARLQAENDALKSSLADAIGIAEKLQARTYQLTLANALQTYKPIRRKGGRPPGRLSFSKYTITQSEWWELFQIVWNGMKVPLHARKTQKMAIDELVRFIEQHDIDQMGGKRWSPRERELKKKRIADSIAEYKKSQKPSA